MKQLWEGGVVYTSPINLSRTFSSLKNLGTVLLKVWTADYLEIDTVLKKINTKPETV